MAENKRTRRPTFQGVIPIKDVQPVVAPPITRRTKPVDLRPYLKLLQRAERVRKDRSENDGLEFIVPVEAQHTLRTRLNQAGAQLDIGVHLEYDPDQEETEPGMVRMVLTTGPRRHRGGNGNGNGDDSIYASALGG